MRVAFVALMVFALPAAASEWEQRAAQFSEQTRAERDKLGLDKKSTGEIRESYPTPEVHFTGKAEGDVSIVLCPGEPKQLSLEGTLPEGAFVTPTTDDVEVSAAKSSRDLWKGTLTAKKNAPPHTFDLRAITPVTAHMADARGLLIGCHQTLTITVEGATLIVKADITGQAQEVTGEWKKGARVLGTQTYQLRLNDGGLTLQAELSDEEMQRRSSIVVAAMQSPKSEALNKRTEKVTEKLEACGKVLPERLMACLAGPQAEMQKIATEREALSADADVKAARLFGCDQLVIEFGGESSASACAAHRSQQEIPAKAAWTSP